MNNNLTEAHGLPIPQQDPPPQHPPQERFARIHVELLSLSPKGERALKSSATVKLKRQITKNDNKNI